MGKNKGKKFRAKMTEGMSHLTTDTILIRMQEKIDSFEYEEAQKYCQEALKRNPDDVTVLEAAGSLCLELNEEERAKHCYGRAITLSPEEGHKKYFTMAQLLSNKDSLQCYLKGIEIITKVINSSHSNVVNKNSNSELANGCANGTPMEASSNSCDAADSKEEEKTSSLAPLIRELSIALCSIAELYMTDLCDEDEAESESLKYIEKAISSDPQNPEACQLMASYLLVKQKKEEAKEYIKKSLDMWLPEYTTIDEGKAKPGTFDPIEPCPLSYDARLSTSRILIEVEEHQSASAVLEGLLGESDEVIDTWYLLGWNAYLQGDDHKPEAKFLLQHALKLKDHPSCDPEMLEHINELLVKLKDVVEETPAENDDDILTDSEDEDTPMDDT